MTTKLQTYRKYKPSGVDWLGDISITWDMRRMKFLFSLLKRPVRDEDDIITAFRDGTVTLRKNRREEGFTVALQESGYQGVRRGDLVIHGMDGAAGAIGVSDSEGKATPVYSVCGPRNEKVVPRYYAYLLRTLAVTGYIASLARGIRERSTEFKWNIIGDLNLLFPPPETQKRIADFLDEKTEIIDELIDKKEKLIELLREKRAAFITRAVTKGLDSNAKLKVSGVEWLGGIPARWEARRMRFLVQTNPSKSEISNLPNQPVSFLSMSHVSENGALDLSEERDLNFIYTGYTYFRDGDVILAKITPCFENGKGAFISGLTNGIGFGSTEFHVFRPKKIHSKFLYYFFASDVFMKFGELNMRRTAGQKRVPELFIKDFVLGVPPNEEQKQIADFLDTETAKIDKAVALIESQIEKLSEYRSSLIYSVVTGKI